MCLVNQPQLVTKVAFPRLVIPLSTAIPPAVDFAVSVVVLVPLLYLHGLGLTAAMLLLPIWVACLLALALGLGFFLSSLAVAYRDVPHVVPFLLQVLMFASPVAYPMSAVPASARFYYKLNPLAVLVDGLRDACFGRVPAADGFLALAVVLSAALFVGGWLFFAKSEVHFADII
jgi:lipopolysaccharide transport system permease protein